MERIMVVPLRKARRGSSARFAPKAVKYLRKFVARHMKANPELVVIGLELNEFIWSRGIRNPPRRVEVRALKKGDQVFVNLAELGEEAWKKFIGEEKKEEKKGKEEKKSVKSEKKEEEKEAEEVLEEIAKETAKEEEKGEKKGKKKEGKKGKAGKGEKK